MQKGFIQTPPRFAHAIQGNTKTTTKTKSRNEKWKKKKENVSLIHERKININYLPWRLKILRISLFSLSLSISAYLGREWNREFEFIKRFRKANPCTQQETLKEPNMELGAANFFPFFRLHRIKFLSLRLARR